MPWEHALEFLGKCRARLFWTVEQESELEYEADDNIKLGTMILVAKYVQKEKIMYL